MAVVSSALMNIKPAIISLNVVAPAPPPPPPPPPSPPPPHSPWFLLSACADVVRLRVFSGSTFQCSRSCTCSVFLCMISQPRGNSILFLSVCLFFLSPHPPFLFFLGGGGVGANGWVVFPRPLFKWLFASCRQRTDSDPHVAHSSCLSRHCAEIPPSN